MGEQTAAAVLPYPFAVMDAAGGKGGATMSYNSIYRDPPWKYNSRAKHKTRFRGSARNAHRWRAEAP